MELKQRLKTSEIIPQEVLEENKKLKARIWELES